MGCCQNLVLLLHSAGADRLGQSQLCRVRSLRCTVIERHHKDSLTV